MNASINSNGGQVAASIETEAAADAEASSENNDGTGSVPASDEEGEANMKKTEATSKQPHEGKEPELAEIEIAQIRFDDVTYPREHINEDAVHEYSETMKKKVRFPEIEVFSSGGTFWLSDGRHRLEAGKMAGMTTIWAKVYQGTQRDAILHSFEANLGCGVRRTNADKRKAVKIVLQDPEWRNWNDTKIASRCHVSQQLVKEVKEEFAGTAHGKELDGGNSSIVERNGKRFLQKRKAAAKPLPAHVSAINEMRELAQKARASVPEGDAKIAEDLVKVGEKLHEILGTVTNAEYRITDLPVPINVYHHKLEGGITASPEFEKKGLATHGVNVGLGCGHQCTYCSSSSSRCRLPAYGELMLSPYGRGYAVIDPKTDERILKDMPKLGAGDTVMLSTCDDPWSPEARKQGVGRKSTEAVLKNTPAQIRILTKSAEVAKDFDVIKGFEKRVMVGLSIGIPESREDVAAVVEPNASPIRDRLKALTEAHNMKLRTYAMLCPCLPLVADSEAALTEMFKAVKVRGAEDIFLEPVNARGKALLNTATALRLAGLKAEADAVDAIRDKEAWSKYATALTENAVKVAEAQGVTDKLKILLYADRFTDADRERLKQHKAVIKWLGKAKDGKPAAADEPETDAADTENGAGAGRTEAA